MSDCRFNSDYECGRKPMKGGCMMCPQFRELKQFILDEDEYTIENGRVFIDGKIFRELVDDYLKDYPKGG